ncbi:hypothetical protein [Ureibacillus sp. FSL K6-0165]|uniref:hypothetical protein n=1 Tax=Ureibacillus sp. FSL K6-0165 TaxID=2954606 RepID=UPI0030F99FDF
MNNNGQHIILDYLVKLIKDERDYIQGQKEDILLLIDSIIKNLEQIKHHTNTEGENYINVDHNLIVIQNRLQSLINTLQGINFAKR